MLTRCPACETNFRVTAEQLKARSGRVRCGACQHVFSALDSLIEEPTPVFAPLSAPLPTQLPPEPAPEPAEQAPEQVSAPHAAVEEALIPETAEPAEPESAEPAAMLAEAPDWSETFPEPPPPPARWPWVIGSLLAFTAIGLQAALAFRIELATLWPEAKPALVALCDFAGCQVGLPAKVALVGIEASDLHPDPERAGHLALSATLKNRAPFAQAFPHLELTLTDTADKAIARKVLAPADYLPPKTALTNGMPANADIVVAVRVDSGEMTASGYRLYLFYP